MPAQLPLPYLPPHFPFIAASRETASLNIGKNASIPCSLHAPASRAAAPANAMTGFPYFFAIFAIPIGAFSHSGLSVHTPFPGNHKISLCNFLLQACFFYYNLDTGFNCASINARNANPKPPAAPVPGYIESAFGIFFLHQRRIRKEKTILTFRSSLHPRLSADRTQRLLLSLRTIRSLRHRQS